MNNLINQLFNDVFGKDLEKFQKEFDNFFEDIYKETSVPSFQLSKGSYPRVNVINKEKEFEVIAAVPGLTREDLEVSFKDGFLTIKGNSKQDKLEEKQGYICQQLKKSSFRKSFRVDPEEIDVENIFSSCKNGELRIRIPKKQEHTKKESFNIKID